MLIALLRRGMMVAAEGLPVGAVPEQRPVALVGNDVVNHGRTLGTAGMGAPREALEEGGTGLAPGGVVAACAGRGAVGVVPGVAGTGGLALARAGGAMRNDAPAARSAEAGRLRHRR